MVLASKMFALEEQERDEMNDQVHLVDGLGSLKELREGLLIARHPRVEVQARFVL